MHARFSMMCIMVRLLPLLENDEQIAKSAVLAPKSFTRSVFRLLRVIRLSRDVLSGSWETAGMVCRALGEGTHLELWNGCWLVDND